MTKRKEIIDFAKTFLGCKFHHQGRVRAGLDCAGLVILVGKEIGSPIEDTRRYGRRPTQGVIVGQLEKTLERIDPEEAEPGDILVFWVTRRGFDQHLAIKTFYGMIHTYMDVGLVVETVYDGYWQDRIMTAFRYNGVTD